MLFQNKPCEKCGNHYDVTFEECPLCHEKDREFVSRKIPKTIAWMSPWQQILLFLIGFAFGGMMLFEIVFMDLFAGLEETQPLLYDFATIASTYVALLIALVLVCLPRIKHLLSHFKSWDIYLYGIGYAITLYAFSTLAGAIAQYGFGVGVNDNQSLVDTYLTAYPFFSVIVMGIVGPVCEELTYRVGLYSFARRLNKYAAIAISTIVFALIHFNFKSSDITTELLNLPSYLVAGVILGIAYEHKGPACSIVAHSLYNTVSLILMLTMA